MEEVRASSNPEDGQPNEELPEPLSTSPETYLDIPSDPYKQAVTSPNTSSLRNSNLEAAYNINTLPQPVEVDQNPKLPEVHETEFDKRNERLRDVPRQQDELAAAGMVALGDVLRDRQATYQAPPNPVPPMPVPPSPRPAPPTTSVSTTSVNLSLYKRAIAIGLATGLIVAPVIIIALIRG